MSIIREEASGNPPTQADPWRTAEYPKPESGINFTTSLRMAHWNLQIKRRDGISKKALAGILAFIAKKKKKKKKIYPNTLNF